MTAEKRILVVDDEHIVAKDIQSTLRSLGYEADVAFSAEEALGKVSELRPDLVLMDIILRGGMSGVEAAEQIRDRFDIPVVYLTALTDEAALRESRVTEQFGYLFKPFENKELQLTIELALLRHGRRAGKQTN